MEDFFKLGVKKLRRGEALSVVDQQEHGTSIPAFGGGRAPHPQLMDA